MSTFFMKKKKKKKKKQQKIQTNIAMSSATNFAWRLKGYMRSEKVHDSVTTVSFR